MLVSQTLMHTIMPHKTVSISSIFYQECISLGSGEHNISEYRSFVLYHNNSPRWSEVIKLPIPIDRFRGSHLRFEFRHCSSKDFAHCWYNFAHI